MRYNNARGQGIKGESNNEPDINMDRSNSAGANDPITYCLAFGVDKKGHVLLPYSHSLLVPDREDKIIGTLRAANWALAYYTRLISDGKLRGCPAFRYLVQFLHVV